jgi:perosamine synthetase
MTAINIPDMVQIF